MFLPKRIPMHQCDAYLMRERGKAFWWYSVPVHVQYMYSRTVHVPRDMYSTYTGVWRRDTRALRVRSMVRSGFGVVWRVTVGGWGWF